MKIVDIYKIGKKDYFLEQNLITKIILKNLKISKKDLFFIDEIQDISDIIGDFEKYKNGLQIEYILNQADFFGLEFYVDNRVLIPRNDTEILVSNAICEAKNNDFDCYFDIGTGSGCVGISFLKNFGFDLKKAFLVDLSLDALEITKINVLKHSLTQINLINSNLLEIFFEKGFLGKNILITSNLPYIKNNDFENMDKEVILNEPKMALYGGEKTGFELYEKLILQIIELKQKFFLEKIVLIIEIGFDQNEVSQKFLSFLNLKFDYFLDNSGIVRNVKIFF